MKTKKTNKQKRTDQKRKAINKILTKMGYNGVSLSTKKKKEVLLQMATEGLLKPAMNTTNPAEKGLALALRRYTYLPSVSFDFEFQQAILELRPDWLKCGKPLNARPQNKLKGKQKILAQMASNGQPRPKTNSQDPCEKGLARALLSYINPKKDTYDENFRQVISEINPNWLRRGKHPKTAAEKRVEQTKKTLIRIAKSKKEKPRQYSKNPNERFLGSALMRYVCVTSTSYDQKFQQTISKLRPDWVSNISKAEIAEKVKTTKKLLLKMAKSKGAKPSRTSNDPGEVRLAHALQNYCSPACYSYDVTFKKAILEANPNWFDQKRETNKEIEQKKKLLLKMAKSKKSKPSRYSKDPNTKALGNVLRRALCPSSCAYDADFKRAILKAAPNWADARAEVIEKTKKLLIEMAKSKQPRPKPYSKDPKEKKLGHFLFNRLYPSSSSYDAAFAKAILKANPEWIRKPKTCK